MSSEKTAQMAAEEYLEQDTFRNANSLPADNTTRAFLAGVTWAKSHDPDVLKLVEAGDNISKWLSDSFDKRHPVTVLREALESYRKGCL